MNPTRVTLALSLSLGLAGACAESGGGDGEGTSDGLFSTEQLSLLSWEGDTRLEQAQSCEDANERYKSMLRVQVLLQLEEQRRWHLEAARNGWGGPGVVMAGSAGMEDGAAESAAPASEPAADNAGAAKTSGGDVPEYSDTNVQVEGVDEADVVKTDGEHVFAVIGGDLVAVRSWPIDEAGELDRVTVQGTPHSVHRRDDKLVVLSWANAWQLTGDDPWSGKEGAYDYHSWQPVSVATVIDAADPTDLKVEKVHAFEGDLLSSRRIGDRIFLVQTSWFWPEGLQTWADVPWNASVGQVNAAYGQVAAKDMAVIDQIEVSDWMPRRYELAPGEELDLTKGEAASACERFFAPKGYAGWALLTVETLDLGTGAIDGSTVVGDWGTVYASEDALYVAASNWGWGWWFQGDFDVQTRIHKFDLAGGVASWSASGSVPGYVLNQFSMDELEGRLRVATTIPQGWWDTQSSESQVTVVEEKGEKLVPVGKVGDLGKGEQIYSVRFVADRGYVVTFRQTDPLYVLDLRNPKAPKVTGELKIPGFSSYMHPLDAEHLLTIGRDANENGQVKGLQFQIFDVADPTDPKLAHKTTLGDDWGTWSEALYDHHAFTYFAQKSLLAVPVSSNTWDDMGNWHYSSELTLFEVDLETGVSPRGAIDHEALAESYEDSESCYGWYSQSAYIRRGVFIGDFIWSVSTLGMRAHDVDDLENGSLVDLALLDPDSLGDQYGCYYGW